MFSSMFQSAMINGTQIVIQKDSQEEEEEFLAPLDILENAKVSYEVFINNKIHTTSHSIQWLPNSIPDTDFPQFNLEHLLIGTHYAEQDSGDQIVQSQENNLYIATVRVPSIKRDSKSVIDTSKLPGSISKYKVVKTMTHEGEVSRARASKVDSNLIASIINTGEVHVYNISEDDEERKVYTPVQKLEGLIDEGFGISWNNIQRNIVGASTGQTICLWNIESAKPILKIEEAHQKIITDFKFSTFNEHVFATVSDDSHFKIWDSRTQKPTLCQRASDNELGVISFNQKDEHIFAVGGEAEGVIQIWDSRMPRSSFEDLNFHKEAVITLEWSPFKSNYLLSGGKDNKIYLWDTDKNGEEQARHDHQDGPPELMFHHVLHQSAIEDVSWCPSTEGLIASCETEMNIQIWKVQDFALADDMDYIDKLHLVQNEDLE